ncbi:MAG: 2-C-methyl-D-erythritol 2,4-cyclodiphosphate synthase [bacterium JZ-2024 1]
MGKTTGAVRVGLGFDVHPLVKGHPFYLVGICISTEIGPAGFSDGDALSHAVADALLGAVGVGDVGSIFKKGDPRFKGIAGDILLEATVKIVESAGWKPAQVDTVIWLEDPPLAPVVPAISTRLAEVLGIEVDAISVKAKRGEGLGFVGRREGVAVWAVAVTTPCEPSHVDRDTILQEAFRKSQHRKGEASSLNRPERLSGTKPLPTLPAKRTKAHRLNLPDGYKVDPSASVTIYLDGGAHPNPGPAAAGIVIVFPDGPRLKAGKFLGEKLTNNEAEYHALLWALEEARQLGVQKVLIRSDSELLVYQITGMYRVKMPHLKALHKKVQDRIREFKDFRIEVIPRSLNSEADMEVTRVLKKE